jgi:carbon starvation protein
MDTVLIVIGSFVLYIIAYKTYGRFLASKVFKIDADRQTPACTINDGVDFVPSKKALVFGHHFTSIAGTGPIVGPAIAVVWGWVPALLWVLLGSIFMGAVHDFGSLIISMRHQGRTIADLSGTVVNARVRILFMIVVVIGLWIVLAIFGLVIATIFKLYPSSVVPVFLQIPIAIALGIWLKKGKTLVLGSLLAVALMYASIIWSSTIDWSAVSFFPAALTNSLSLVAIWTIILMIYVFIASVLPVDVLLQPRDFINSWQLLIAMGLLVVGVLIAHPPIVADAVRLVPDPSASGTPAPPMFPFLFITIACGAVSGFHCLVSSGCSSRQLKTESDAQYVGYGAMLTEGFLATLVIIACIAGIGMATNSTGALSGHEIWLSYYQQWGGDGGLGDKLTPFIQGAANMIASIGISQTLAITIMGVFVASFAATTLDSATRLQRYVIAELAMPKPKSDGIQCASCNYPREGLPSDAPCPECSDSQWIHRPRLIGRLRKLVANRYGATSLAVTTALIFALSDGIHIVRKGEMFVISGNILVLDSWHRIGNIYYELRWENAGLGGLALWPIFGATNQLLAALALLVITVWLVKSKRAAWITALPMLFMLTITAYAIILLIKLFVAESNPLLLSVSALMLILQLWIVIEAALLLKNEVAPPIQQTR